MKWEHRGEHWLMEWSKHSCRLPTLLMTTAPAGYPPHNGLSQSQMQQTHSQTALFGRSFLIFYHIFISVESHGCFQLPLIKSCDQSVTIPLNQYHKQISFFANKNHRTINAPFYSHTNGLWGSCSTRSVFCYQTILSPHTAQWTLQVLIKA